MDLKRQIRKIIAEQKSDQKLKEIEYEKSLLRSDEDWEIIDNYLSSLLLQKAQESNGSKREIKLYTHCRELILPFNDSGEKIFLTNKELRINHKDIERFCKQHHFGLWFINSSYYDELKKSFHYDDIRTRFYLIKV